MRSLSGRIVVISLCVAALGALPGVSLAAPSSATTKTAAASANEYDLAFTLPTAGKSGCQVCHGDPSLVKVSLDATSSIFVDSNVLASSAHANALCTGCHVDFAYKTPHDNVVNGGDWRDTAKISCKNCKEHAPQFSDYTAGAHSPAGVPGESAAQTAARRAANGQPAKVPFCGTCHGSHAIPSKNDTEAVEAVHMSQIEMCGQCHEDQVGTYTDYYHGAAYRVGAKDAPACTDCHGTHQILPPDDRRSTLSDRNIEATCGQDGCHEGDLDEEFLSYARLIHGREDQLVENPVYSAIYTFRQGVMGVVESVSGWFD